MIFRSLLSLRFFLVVGFISSPALALNTNMFEKDSTKSQSFTAKVRVVRDISDEVEVFFDSDQARGAYSLPRNAKEYGAALKLLVDSSKTQGTPVTVTADKDSKVIFTVQKPAAPAAPALDPVKDFDKIFK